MTANRNREIRLSGMIGGLAETWAMVKAIRAHQAETPKQTSFYLMLCALYFYPDYFSETVTRKETIADVNEIYTNGYAPCKVRDAFR